MSRSLLPAEEFITLTEYVQSHTDCWRWTARELRIRRGEIRKFYSILGRLSEAKVRSEVATLTGIYHLVGETTDDIDKLLHSPLPDNIHC